MNKKPSSSNLSENQKQELEEFQRRLKQAQGSQISSHNPIQTLSNTQKSDFNLSNKSQTPKGLSKVNFYKGRNGSIDINSYGQSPQNTDQDKIGLDSMKSPWSILKLENTGSNFNNTTQINTLSLTGDNRMTPKDFDEQLYIKKVQQYNQQSNINADQILQKMLNHSESNLQLKSNSSKKDLSQIEGRQIEEIYQLNQQQLLQQQQQIQDKTAQQNNGHNSFLNSSQNNGSSQLKNRLQVKSIRMFETENSLIYPKKLNLDSSFQRKHNFSFDKVNATGNQTGLSENDCQNQALSQQKDQQPQEKNSLLQQQIHNILNDDKMEIQQQQNNLSKNIEFIPTESTPERFNPFFNPNQNQESQQMNYKNSMQLNSDNLKQNNSLLQKPIVQRVQYNKATNENKQQEDDQMITSTSSSGLKRVQFSVDINPYQTSVGYDRSGQQDLKNLLHNNKKNLSDPQFQMQQQFKNKQTIGSLLQKKTNDVPLGVLNSINNQQNNMNNRSNSSYVSTQSYLNSNNAIAAAISMDKANNGSINSLLNNPNESTKQLIDVLSNLKNEYRKNFYSRQIDNVLEEKVRQHHTRENSKDKIFQETQSSLKNELTKRPLTAKLIQSNIQRKNSSKDQPLLNKSIQNEKSQQDSKINHPGSNSIGNQSAIPSFKDGSSKENTNINTNLHFRKFSQNNPSTNNAHITTHNESKNLNESSLRGGNTLNNITFSKIQSPKNILDISSPKEVGNALNKNINLDNAKDVQFLYSLIKDHIQKCPTFCKDISKYLE